MATDDEGNKVWERELDIYGSVQKEKGIIGLVPHLFQGQYWDGDVDLAYNRMRYYSTEAGSYISQDPIGLAGGMLLYGYVHDTNNWIDVFGLKGIIPTVIVGNSNEILEATATVKKVDLGTGTATDKSSRAYARSMGNIDDDAGHIIGKNLGGSGGKKNVFP